MVVLVLEFLESVVLDSEEEQRRAFQRRVLFLSHFLRKANRKTAPSRFLSHMVLKDDIFFTTLLGVERDIVRASSLSFLKSILFLKPNITIVRFLPCTTLWF